MSSNSMETYTDLNKIAASLREKLESKKCILLFAHNHVGKTRLSMEFKNIGEKENGTPDTLYFNSFTEDLFSWHDDPDGEMHSVLRINRRSYFYESLRDLSPMEELIREMLGRHVSFEFLIDYRNAEISFSRGKDPTPIKVSRGEENIFIWCFFLAVIQFVIDRKSDYDWVKYVYIDDPISSLDDDNTIAVACHLANFLEEEGSQFKIIVSTHHALFFNVMYHEMKGGKESYFLAQTKDGEYSLRGTGDNPSFHHIALLQQLYEAAESGNLYTYHFNSLRSIMEKTAAFHGFANFSECIQPEGNGMESDIHARMMNLLSHGKHSLFAPREMSEEYKEYFKKILDSFIKSRQFNQDLIKATTKKS